MSEHSLTIREEHGDLQPTELLSAIAAAVQNPAIDVAKMERLLAMHKEIVADQRKQVFMSAMSRLQARLQPIEKNGIIMVKGVERSRYAKLEDIDVAIRPLLKEFGFAFTFDTVSTDAKFFTITATLLHEDGHSESKSLMLPADDSQFRSAIQSIASTISFGKRQLIKMFLNIVEKSDEDTDLKPISQDQVKHIEVLIADTKTNKPKFLEYMNCASIDQIPVRDVTKAMTMLLEKKRRMEEKK